MRFDVINGAVARVLQEACWAAAGCRNVADNDSKRRKIGIRFIEPEGQL